MGGKKELWWGATIERIRRLPTKEEEAGVKKRETYSQLKKEDLVETEKGP